MVTQTRDLKEFVKAFNTSRKLGDVVSRMTTVAYDGSYGRRAFYLHPLPRLTKSKFQFYISQDPAKKGEAPTWSLAMMSGGKVDLETKEPGLDEDTVLRRILEIIKREEN